MYRTRFLGLVVGLCGTPEGLVEPGGAGGVGATVAVLLDQPFCCSGRRSPERRHGPRRWSGRCGRARPGCSPRLAEEDRHLWTDACYWELCCWPCRPVRPGSPTSATRHPTIHSM